MIIIPIPLPPIGVNRVATARGSVLKVVPCEQCQRSYGYVIELEAAGEDYDLDLDPAGSATRAMQKAVENFERKRGNSALPVPCPYCGW